MSTVDLTKRAVTNITESRETKFLNRYNMFNGNYRALALNHLKGIYADPEGLGLDKQLDITNNIFKTIVNKISRVYKFGYTRDIEDDKLSQLYTNMRVQKTLNQANVYLNAFNDVLLQVTWVNNKPKLVFRLPHKTRVVIDENNLPKEVEYFIGRTLDNKEKWAYWSDTEHYYKLYGKDGSFDIESVNDKNINPYGVLPFVFMQKGFRDAEYFDVFSGEDLYNITLDNAIYNTFKNYMIKWQSFKQIYTIGATKGDLDGKVFDPQYVLNLSSEDGKIGILDIQADLTNLRDTLNDSANTVAINYNISPSQFNMTSTLTSGFSKMMDNASLDEDTIAQQSDFETYEKELYDLIVLISEKNNIKYKDGYTISINEPYYKEDKSTQLDVIQKEIELGLTNQINYIMQRDEVDEKTATETFNANLKIRNQSNQRVDIPTAETIIEEV